MSQTQGVNKKDSYDCKFYKVKEIAAILGISERTAYDFCNATLNKNKPEFLVRKLGRTIRVHKDSFNHWFDLSDIQS